MEKGRGHFYFFGGLATDWIDRTAQASKITELTLEQSIWEFLRMKRLNREIMRTGTKVKTTPSECIRD